MNGIGVLIKVTHNTSIRWRYSEKAPGMNEDAGLPWTLAAGTLILNSQTPESEI